MHDGTGAWERGAIAGLGVRDIIGYCVTTLLFSGVVFVAGMYLFGRSGARGGRGETEGRPGFVKFSPITV